SDGDTIEIGFDVVYPEPDTHAVFLVSTIVVKLVQHEEELRVRDERRAHARIKRHWVWFRMTLEKSDGDTIEIGVDVVYPEPDTHAVFLVSTIVVKLVQHEEELRV
nr:hypothetical protein [Tanacetum cinerariifolium]